MPDFVDLARGLLTLEINTVEKEGMSAQKMPTAPNAMIEIAQTYWNFLCQKATDFGLSGQELPKWANTLSKSFDWGREPFPQPKGRDRPIADTTGEPRPPGYDPLFLKDPPATVTLDVLDNLREIATWMAEMQLRTLAVAEGEGALFASLRDKLSDDDRRDARAAARKFRPEERAIFHRIRRNCDQFKEIARRCGGPIERVTSEEAFTPAELVQIRKAWDIGTELILMQTVIQIDGDVVNRFQRGMDDPSKAQLQALHAGAVDLSFKYWRWLIDTLGQIAGTAVSTLLGRP